VPERLPTAGGRRARSRPRSSRALLHAALAFGALVSLLPFLTMLSTSLMTLGETYTRAPWPAQAQWQNYVQAWNDAHFDQFFRNSVLIALTVITGVLITCTLAGYAFARIRFPGRDAIFTLLLATLMIPGTVTFIPSFLLVRGDVFPWGSGSTRSRRSPSRSCRRRSSCSCSGSSSRRSPTSCGTPRAWTARATRASSRWWSCR
jgi:ABC-type glycerol-3-phosphate transport system permease component